MSLAFSAWTIEDSAESVTPLIACARSAISAASRWSSAVPRPSLRFASRVSRAFWVRSSFFSSRARARIRRGSVVPSGSFAILPSSPVIASRSACSSPASFQRLALERIDPLAHRAAALPDPEAMPAATSSAAATIIPARLLM
jgi:hypothetical protein